MLNSYNEFLNSKVSKEIKAGFEVEDNELNPHLFDWQKSIVKWALRNGRVALFEDTGLGKTIQQLSFADAVCKHIGGGCKVLILAPLAVSKQTRDEAEKFGIKCKLVESEEDVEDGINITNYEKLHKFDSIDFDGVVLDESSIMKNSSGKTTRQLIDRFKDTPYKLCCTATPSPNDYTEIGSTAEFLGIMNKTEMLATFFINDSIHGDGWRIKRHAEHKFFEWIATWAMMIKNPRDLGFDGSKFDLPKLNIIHHIIESQPVDSLLVEYAETLNERREARRNSLNDRVKVAKEIAEKTDCCLIWCDFNNESDALHKAINESVEVRGSDTDEHKEKSLLGFSHGEIKYLVSKPSIAGYGLNWQHCNNMIFCGLSDSFEMFYQAIRRCYRFGQTKDVNVHIIISEREMNVLKNIQRKQAEHERLSTEMVKIMSEISKGYLIGFKRKRDQYIAKCEFILPSFLK